MEQTQENEPTNKENEPTNKESESQSHEIELTTNNKEKENERLNDTGKEHQEAKIEVPKEEVVELQPWQIITPRQRRIVTASVVLCLFLAALDQNIVIVALPTIVADMGHSALLSWVVAAFMLTSSAMTALYGRLSDVFGRRNVYLACLLVFVIGSAIGGSAQNIWWLIVGRGVQGLGGGGLIALGVIVFGDIAEPKERPKYLSSIAAMFGISSILGPVAGGLFTEYVTWRWVFYINLPLGIIAFIGLFLAMKYENKQKALQLDYLGSIFVGCGAVCVVLFTTWGGASEGYPWGSGVIVGLLEGAVLFLLLFVWQESRHPLPMLNLSFFKQRLFSLVCGIMFCGFFVMFGGMVYITIYFQEVKGNSPTIAGLKLTPLVGGLVVSAGFSGQRMSRTGNPNGLLPLGAASISIASGILITLEQNTNYGLIAFCFVLLGFGMGFILPVSNTIIQNSVPPKEMANALSSLRFFQNLAGAIGVAVFGAIFDGATKSRMTQTFNLHASMAYGVAQVMAVSCGLALVCFCLALMLPSVKLFSKEHAVPAEPAGV